LKITYDDPNPTNIKMPLLALAPPNETKWLVSTEIGGRDCGWKSTGIEVDLAHTDANNSTGTNGTFFSIDFPKKVIINGTPDDWSGKTVPALAPFGGNVTKVGETSCGGKFVSILKDSGDFEVHLLHLDKQLVKMGAHVNQGQIVGIVGSTGTCTTAPHLHMTVVYKGQGGSNIEALTKLQMEGLLLKQYQTDCDHAGNRTQDSYYPSSNVALPPPP
jgi:Peptidase family M23